MSAPYFLAVKGRYIIQGKEPDGDSVRFIADNPLWFSQLRRGHRVRVAPDGSVQLRLEGVDAPELHYGDFAQPLGVQARDVLFEWLGFHSVEYDRHNPNVIRRAEPYTIPGFILTSGSDPNGRPVSYLIGGDNHKLEDGQWAMIDERLLKQTLNTRLVETGTTYTLCYTSTPFMHRQFFKELAIQASAQKLGVWELDTTRHFRLENHHSIGTEGQLILPKIFRRCCDFLDDSRHHRFKGTIEQWLVWTVTQHRHKDDRIVVDERDEVFLHDLVEQRGDEIYFLADPANLTFYER
jgi:endonuclease YncB( thermonuclease family)